MAKGSYATVLSVRQPWAWLLVHGYKDIENRNWSTDFRGRCLIHAGKSFDQEGYEWVRQHFRNIKMPPPSSLRRGGIVGWVEITDCVTQSRSRWFFGKYGFVIGKRGELPFAPLRGKLGLFPLEQPCLVIVEVTPDSLEVDSGEMADVRVSVRDLDGLPLAGIPLYGQTDPHEMGPVSIFEDTDTDGDSTGTWTAGTVVRTGKLIVSAPDAQGEADIELYSPPDGDDDDDDDEDDDEDNGDGDGNGHGPEDGNGDGNGNGGTGGRGGSGKGQVGGKGHGETGGTGGRGGTGKGHGPGDGNGNGNGGSHGGRRGPGKGGKGPGQGTTGGKHGTGGKGGGGSTGGRGGLDVGDKSLGGGG